jgi:hypothetical protein
MREEVKHHVFKIFEQGKGKRYEVISAFSPAEAKKQVEQAWPDCKALLIETRPISGPFS